MPYRMTRAQKQRLTSAWNTATPTRLGHTTCDACGERVTTDEHGVDIVAALQDFRFCATCARDTDPFQRSRTRLHAALCEFVLTARQLGIHWTLIGGLAVSLRTEPRTTTSVDALVAVKNPDEFDRLADRLHTAGSVGVCHWESLDTGRVSLIRSHFLGSARGVRLNLLAVWSGIGQRIVAASTLLDAGIVVPVARLGHLLALKTLAGRDQDLRDFPPLLAHATACDVNDAREVLADMRIPGRDLLAELAERFERCKGDGDLLAGYMERGR